MRTGSVRNFLIRFSTGKTRSSLLAIALILLPHFASADVRITEFVYDAQGSDDKKEWIEIFNGGPSAVDIAKWKVSDGSNHVLNAPPKNGSVGTTTLEPNSFLILADDASTFIAMYGHSTSILDTSIDLPNANGTISLVDGAGKIMDSVSYSKSLGAAGNGNSLQKTTSGNWIEAKPTPGTLNAEVAEKIMVPVAEKSSKSKKSVASTAPKQVGKGKSSKYVADAEAPQDTNAAPIEDTGPAIEETASAAAPGFASPWFLGAMGITGAAAAAGFVAKRKKKDEWEIIEETD